MASDSASRSSSASAADNYIGCLISLTSKSEIRYEGVLYNINTDESSIGLSNVRSFGTEGRKKDGPQIPPGDKVYEYILFRGSDIKDLQVKSTPPVPPTPPMNSDPAIIQSHYPRSVTTSTSLPAVTGSLTGLSSHNTPQLGFPGSNFQGPLPLYQPGGNMGSWGASPSAPNAIGGGLAMPMNWQGYYGAPNGLPHIHQQSLIRPPSGLSMPSSMQQPMQFPNFSPSLPTGPVNLTEIPSSLLAVSTSSPSVTASVPPSITASTLPQAPSAALASATLPVAGPNKAPPISLPAVSLAAKLSSLTSFMNAGPETSANNKVPEAFNKPNAISGSSTQYQTVSQLTSAIGAGSSNSIHTETPVRSLVTPGQLLQPGSTAVSSSEPSQTHHKDVEVIQVSSKPPPDPSLPVSAESQAPILPLPANSQLSHRPGGAPSQTHHGYGYRGHGSGGRGRGAGALGPVSNFTEDFDFMAMNEKFNKVEVWGHLGKSSKSHSKEKHGEENASDEDDILAENNADMSKLEIKHVYNKDDFFDSLSCNALGNDSHNGRIRYSEQIKIDAETFGDFPKHRGGWVGRGLGHDGGRSRGGYYYGRGYGYAGRRGRGRGGSGRF